jgi:hypothetical protein
MLKATRHYGHFNKQEITGTGRTLAKKTAKRNDFITFCGTCTKGMKQGLGNLQPARCGPYRSALVRHATRIQAGGSMRPRPQASGMACAQRRAIGHPHSMG